MDRPEISKDFTMDDIRRLRDYNSARHLTMSYEEIKAEGKKAMEMFFLLIEKDDKLKKLIN